MAFLLTMTTRGHDVMPRHKHTTNYTGSVEYSPTEVADLGLLGLKRAAIYKAIKRGDLHIFYNEWGEYRISQAEIERLQHVWKVEPPETSHHNPADPVLLQAVLRERGRMGGHAKAATHSREEIAEPLRRGKRKWLEQQVDPAHILPPDELERRVQAAHKQHMDKARLARAEKALLQQQYGNEQA
jgi:hypothetical protein